MYTSYVEFYRIKVNKRNGVGAHMIEKFINELERQGLSKNTIKSYEFDIAQFCDWLKSKELDPKITEEVLTEYTIFLYSKYSENTVLRKIKSVTRYNKYLYHIEESPLVIEPNEIIKIKTNNRTMRMMSINEFDRLRQTILEGQNKRDILIFHLLYGTCCRISELINIELDDIEITDPSQGYIQFKILKSGKFPIPIRKISITEPLIKMIKDYLEFRPIYQSKKLLIGQKGPMTRDAINKMFRKYSSIANINYTVSPQMLRRMGIFNLLVLAQNEPFEISYISKIARYTTESYTEKIYESLCSNLKGNLELQSFETRYINLGWGNGGEKPKKDC